MFTVLPKLLLIVLFMVSLEGMASLEGTVAQHDDDSIHVHEGTDSDSASNDESHCSHCFHHHATGLLTRADNLSGQASALYTAEIQIRFDSNPIIPPTPPPNLQI
jgi:hypothetical protein